MGQGNAAPFGVVEIKATHDVAGELRLSPPTCKMLSFIAEHGGEVPFTWDSFAQKKLAAKTLIEAQAIDQSRDMVVDLINAGYVREREYVAGSNVRLTLRLTDKGRNVVAELDQFKLVSTPVQSVTREEFFQEIKK